MTSILTDPIVTMLSTKFAACGNGHFESTDDAIITHLIWREAHALVGVQLKERILDGIRNDEMFR
jgi:hypothetical protein